MLPKNGNVARSAPKCSARRSVNSSWCSIPQRIIAWALLGGTTQTRVSTFRVLFSASCGVTKSRRATVNSWRASAVVAVLGRHAQCDVEQVEVERSIEHHPDAPAGAHAVTLASGTMTSSRLKPTMADADSVVRERVRPAAKSSGSAVDGMPGMSSHTMPSAADASRSVRFG